MVELTDTEAAIIAGQNGSDGDRRAMEIVVETARMVGANRLVDIRSSHIDGCLYHGDSGVLFVEALVAGAAAVRVPTTTNVGALNLLKPEQCRLSPEARQMAFRLMVAHERLGCRPSWTCAPYQAGQRPGLGDQVAWGESNAVAFVNSVLGARTNRYGDFLDIACAISGKAPETGLHLEHNRRAGVVFDISGLSPGLRRRPEFYPALGALIGRMCGDEVPAVVGAPADLSEDVLKAFCAAAASTGSVALLHVVGVTPEAPTMEAVVGRGADIRTAQVTAEQIARARDSFSLSADGPIDSVALGSPHFSLEECRALARLAGGRRFRVPVFVCLGRHVLEALEISGEAVELSRLGVEFVADTCVVVTPILPKTPGVMMTNSGKFAHYAQGNTGHVPVFGSLEDCVESAILGHVVRQEAVWA